MTTQVLKKTGIILLVSGMLMALSVNPAKADVDVHIGFGFPVFSGYHHHGYSHHNRHHYKKHYYKPKHYYKHRSNYGYRDYGHKRHYKRDYHRGDRHGYRSGYRYWH
jgi:hypothetical protein